MPPYVSRTGTFLILCATALPTFGADVGQTSPTLPLWEAGVVGGAVSTPAYPAASDRSTRALALPYIIYRGEVIRADRDGIGARLVRNNAFEFDVGFALSLPARSKDVAARAGMSDLGTLLEFGPQLKLNLADTSPTGRLRAELPLRAVFEVKGGARQQGYAFEPRLVYEERALASGWGFGANVSAVISDARLGRYFYEVAPEFANGGRPAYQAKAGLIVTRLGVSMSYKVSPDLSLFAFVRAESYAGSANRDSPLYQRRASTAAGLAFAWTLARSQARAAN